MRQFAFAEDSFSSWFETPVGPQAPLAWGIFFQTQFGNGPLFQKTQKTDPFFSN